MAHADSNEYLKIRKTLQNVPKTANLDAIFDQLRLRKIIKTVTVATRCQILRLKCTKFDFGSAPDPAGELTALPRTP